MSEFIEVGRRHDGEAPTVEGRLADILDSEGCVVRVDEYKLSEDDKLRVIKALRLAAMIAEIAHSYRALTRS